MPKTRGAGPGIFDFRRTFVGVSFCLSPKISQSCFGFEVCCGALKSAARNAGGSGRIAARMSFFGFALFLFFP